MFENDKILNPYSNQEANLDRDENDAEKRSHASDEIEFVDLPNEDCSVKVYQANDCRDDDGREDGVWSILKKRCDE